MEKVYPRQFRIPAQQEFVRSFKDPHSSDISVIHALVKVRDLPNGQIPDKINPRSHEEQKLTGRIAEAIDESLETNPQLFHLLNRGCLVLAKKAWYDNQTKILHFEIESEDDHGLVDGGTTDRVLRKIKDGVSAADFYTLKEDEVPEKFKEAYIHLEIISGEIDQNLRIRLADARNTSVQVKEFSLQDLGGEFEWLKDILENSEFKGKIRYRENEPRDVDIRVVLALLTLFHPDWENRDPIVAYTGKGTVLDYYKDPEWRKGFEKLAPVVLDILRLYDYVHVEFKTGYKDANGKDGNGSRLGGKKEIHYIKEASKAKKLALTGNTTQHVIPDGWLYPLLASLRPVLVWPKNGRGEVRWATDPYRFFDEHAPDLISFLVERSEELGRNPNATGKSKGVWLGLRGQVKNWMLEERLNQLENQEAGEEPRKLKLKLVSDAK